MKPGCARLWRRHDDCRHMPGKEFAMLASLTAKSQAIATDATAPEAAVEGLAAYLVDGGVLDTANLERARRLAGESGNRLDTVLTQLGLVSDYSLAEGLAAILGLRIATPTDYPENPILPDRL